MATSSSGLEIVCYLVYMLRHRLWRAYKSLYAFSSLVAEAATPLDMLPLLEEARKRKDETRDATFDTKETGESSALAMYAL